MFHALNGASRVRSGSTHTVASTSNHLFGLVAYSVDSMINHFRDMLGGVVYRLMSLLRRAVYDVLSAICGSACRLANLLRSLFGFIRRVIRTWFVSCACCHAFFSLHIFIMRSKQKQNQCHKSRFRG